MTTANPEEKHYLDHPELEPWIETYTGKTLHFLTPSVKEIDIEDIAHALANECRFGGHTSRYYSVAEHSVLVATLVPPKHRLAALLHDASEAYLRDIASPIKQYLTSYKPIEDGLMKVIAEKFGFDWPMSAEIKEADTMALKAEARQLLPSKGETWVHLYPTDKETDVRLNCWSPEDAKDMFLACFDSLTRPNVWVPEKEIIVAK